MRFPVHHLLLHQTHLPSNTNCCRADLCHNFRMTGNHKINVGAFAATVYVFEAFILKIDSFFLVKSTCVDAKDVMVVCSGVSAASFCYSCRR